MFSHREIAFGFPKQDGARMREFAEPPLAMISAHARMTRSVEGHAFDHKVDANLVDAASAVLGGGHYLLRPFHILGEQIEGKAVFATFDFL